MAEMELTRFEKALPIFCMWFMLIFLNALAATGNYQTIPLISKTDILICAIAACILAFFGARLLNKATKRNERNKMDLNQKLALWAITILIANMSFGLAGFVLDLSRKIGWKSLIVNSAAELVFSLVVIGVTFFVLRLIYREKR
ncbi:MAG: hypothetical protein HY764_03345 [Candidatus Portnoybacteria bacterium]|nr:hypothetical protein [Candidatus Portnoybacteria bacterium]